jgi:hypothetical protein
MRRLSIFLYFLAAMTAGLHTAALVALVPLMVTFVFLYNLAEQLDEET